MKKNKKWLSSSPAIISALGVTLTLGAMAALAAPVPNTFVAGAPISATAVNANFANIEARLAALETFAPITTASLAGTWAFSMTTNSSNGQNQTCSIDANQGVTIQNEIVRGAMVFGATGQVSPLATTGFNVSTTAFGKQGAQYGTAMSPAYAVWVNGAPPRTFPTYPLYNSTLTCGTNADRPTTLNMRGTFTFTGGPLNAISLNVAGGGVFSGNVSQNGQVMMLQATNAALHQNMVFTLVKVK